MERKKRKTALLVAVAALALLVGWAVLNARRLPTVSAPPLSREGVFDLSQIDLTETVALLPVEWAYYPGLHTPEEIASGAAGAPRTFQPEDETTQATGTYRAVLRLGAGGMYAMNAWSLDYATRVYLDGKEALSVGAVSPDGAGFVPRVQNYILPVPAQGETVEIVIQYANFFHPEGGAMREAAFSSHRNVQRYAEDLKLPTILFCGALTLLAVFYLLQFLIYRRVEMATFALCCLLTALRSQPFLMALLPLDYDLTLLYKSYFVWASMIFPCFLLLTHLLYPGRFKKWVLPATFAALGVMDLVQFCSHTAVSARMVTPAILLMAPGSLYYFARLLPALFRGSVAQRLSSFGLAVFFVSYLFDLLLQGSVPIITRAGLAPFGMAAAILCYMLSLSQRRSDEAVQLDRERRRAESLAHINAMKTEFLQNVTHELKTPLTVISGYAQDSLAVLGGGEEALSDVAYNQRHIEAEADRLNSLVNQLLDVAAIEGGRMTMAQRPVSLAALLRETARVHFPMLNQNGNRLEFALTEGLPDIMADPERIGQVALNLLSNAARHTAGGVLTVTLRAGDGWQEAAFSDTGEGMDEQIQAQAFQSYIDRPGAARGRGGMGLYICGKIIAAHGGEIGIESEKGRGTRVWFRLPEHRKEEGV